MLTMLTGGCACGTVRYSVDAVPYDTGWCHCRICQQVSGSGGMVFTTVALTHFTITQGLEKLGRFASTPFGERRYCRECGSPIAMHVQHQASEIDIAAASLDDPDIVAPTFHIYAASAPAWALAIDGLPRYDALRPTTRGLAQGQTEA